MFCSLCRRLEKRTTKATVKKKGLAVTHKQRLSALISLPHTHDQIQKAWRGDHELVVITICEAGRSEFGDQLR